MPLLTKSKPIYDEHGIFWKNDLKIINSEFQLEYFTEEGLFASKSTWDATGIASTKIIPLLP